MTQIYDFSKALIRCSGLYYIMAPAKERTPKQKYNDLCAVLAEECKKYDDMGERVQGMKSGLTKAAKIAGLEQEIAKLEPKKHEDPLSNSAKYILRKMYGELKYNRYSVSKDKGTKYTTKGKMAEQDSLDLMSFLDGQNYIKNEKRLTNEFLTGIPDTFIGESIETALYVPDTKTSWDLETFMENVGKPLNPLYWWQLQGYFDLTTALGGEVSYCLVNTPQSIIEDERMKLAKKMDAITNESPEYRLAEAMLINNMTFDDIPEQERRLKFEVNRDDEAIKRIHEKVPQCREYLSEIQELHLTGFFSDKELPVLETIEEL